MDEQLHDHDHDRGLGFDLSTLIARRRLFSLFAGVGLAVVAASCASDDASTSTSSGASPTSVENSTAATAASTAAATTPATADSTATTTAASTATATDLEVIPEETAGPFPGDGSNGPDVLSESGIVRSDLRSSFGSSTTTAEGVPATISLQLVDVNGGAPLAGAAVYVWHCDAEGRYSLYSDGVTNENYLRGVQEADSKGVVTFTTVFPGCYDGRWPHVHYEVYPTLADATTASNILATSQLALTQEASAAVYATDLYPDSAQSLSRTSLSTDNVFRDGAELETPTTTGNVTDGFAMVLTVAVNA